MPETKRMAEEANRMGQEAQQQAKRVGQEFQKLPRVALKQRAAHSVKSIKASRPLLPR
jgi:hypothetical protein